MSRSKRETRQEQLLNFFLCNPNIPVAYSSILDIFHGRIPITAIQSMIGALRSKGHSIATIKEFGYRLQVPDVTAAYEEQERRRVG